MYPLDPESSVVSGLCALPERPKLGNVDWVRWLLSDTAYAGDLAPCLDQITDGLPAALLGVQIACSFGFLGREVVVARNDAPGHALPSPVREGPEVGPGGGQPSAIYQRPSTQKPCDPNRAAFRFIGNQAAVGRTHADTGSTNARSN